MAPRKNLFAAVAEFNETVPGLFPPDGHDAQMLPQDRLEWFLTALREEIAELEDAKTVADQADAILDLIYFSAGRLHEMGVRGQVGFDLIHQANMGKVPGGLAKRPGSKGRDAVKPEGWKAPDISPALRKPKVLVLGFARHGKDTVSTMLCERLGLRFASSSLFAAERILMPYFASLGRPYGSAEECYEDRQAGENRAHWFQQICAYNEKDPARLAREMLVDHDIYCGMRNAVELEGCKNEELFDVIVWVDRLKHVAPEARSSCTVLPFMADTVIDNNGDLTDLSRNVDQFIAEFLS